jgi:hypothetical protein
MTSISCAGDGSSIFYDVSTIDIKANPEKAKPASAFEAVFLGDVIQEISGTCYTIQENCKTQYPNVKPGEWKKWLTSLDQENRMSLAHTIEKSNIPILYNTPRLCDPGVSISKNWNLKNYIETRLYLFKFKYDLGQRIAARNVNNCYPSVVFDFRPFTYKLVLPGDLLSKDNWRRQEQVIHFTEWITVEDSSGAEGFTPHMRLSSQPFTVNRNQNLTSEKIFDKMVEKLIQTPLGTSKKSLIERTLYLGNAETGMNRTQFLLQFRKFIQQYDGVEFWSEPQRGPSPRVVCHSDVIRVLFYDLCHDSVVKKADYKKFHSRFKQEFLAFVRSSNSDFQIDRWTGAKTAGNSYAKYKTILKMSGKPLGVPELPAICKTLGDLSQFVYASHYDTIVASGDKMGIATGLYVNARENKKVKCMMEDVITGFVIYSGMEKIDFVSKSTCVAQTNNVGQCKRNGTANKQTVANRIRVNVPPEKLAVVKEIRNKKPVGLKNLLNLISNASRNRLPQDILTSLGTFERYKNYLDINDLKRIEEILTIYSSRENINNSTKTKVFEMLGEVKGKINTMSPMNVNQRPTNGMNVNQRPTNGMNVNQRLTNGMNVNQRPTNGMNVKQNLRAYLNNTNKFTRLTTINKNNFLAQLNRNGSNLNTIKKSATNLQNRRELNAYLNTKQLNDNRKNYIKSLFPTTPLNTLKSMANNQRGIKRRIT